MMSQSGLTKEVVVAAVAVAIAIVIVVVVLVCRLVGLLPAWLVLLWRLRSLHAKSLFNLEFCFQRCRNRFSSKQNRICL